MGKLLLKPKHARTLLLYSIYVLLLAVTLSSLAAGKSEGSGSLSLTKADKEAEAEKRRQTKRMYSLFDHIIRICVCCFLSAVFAGLTLGVMCADTFTLEIIAESGPAPDCKYAAQVLPLRKQGHKTLCTLIVSNMLCNVLIVQEFSSVFDIIYAIRTHGNTNNVVDDSGSQLLNFIVSTFIIVIFAEILPMSVCKSKYSLKVAAAGSIFVRVAMVLTYPVSAPLGKFLDWVVGTEETGQVYDRKELRKLMLIHYDHEHGNGDDMPKSELNLLLAAMDFQERRVKDIMTPIASATYVNENDVITPDFVERLWLSGRSRVPVESALGGHFCDVLVVKDLLTINIGPDEEPMTVSQVVKARNRLFAMVGENTTLPAMMKFFQDAKMHMAVVFAEEQEGGSSAEQDGAASGEAVTRAITSGSTADANPTETNGETAAADAAAAAADTGSATPAPALDFAATARRSFAKNVYSSTTNMQNARTVGIVTMEDVVEELLNDEIYDEYDRYEPDEQVQPSPTIQSKPFARTPNSDPRVDELRVPPEPTKPPRVNFYSYFTHPESNIPLTEAQVWAVAYFLSRTVKAFMLWPPSYIKMLLDDSEDLQLVSPAVRRGSIVTDASNGTGMNSSTTSAGLLPSSSVSPSPGCKPPGAEESGSTPEGGSVVIVPAIDLRSEHTMESSATRNMAHQPTDSPNSRAIRRFDHVRFLSQAADEKFIMYSIGVPSELFTLVLGGQIDMLVGSEKFYSRLRSFQFIGEEALTDPFYAPDFSAIVSRAARVYRISKEKYERFLSYQTVRQRLHTHLRVLRTPQSAGSFQGFGAQLAAVPTAAIPGRGGGGGGSGRNTRVNSRAPDLSASDQAGGGGERDALLRRPFSDTALEAGASPVAKAYGTFKKDKY